MEQQKNSYNVTITALSPIYIGSGDKYSQLDYILQGNKIIILDFDKVLSLIPFEIIDDLTNDILENFENNRWKGDVQEFLKKYKIDWSQCEEKKYDLVGTIGKNEINQFIKTGNKAYIPGSSVKGAIRTAVLFTILKNRPEQKRILENYIISEFDDREIKKLLQSESPDGKKDLFRALVVSDFKTESEIAQVLESTIYHLKNKESTVPIFNEVLGVESIAAGTVKIQDHITNSGYLYSKFFKLQKDEIVRAIKLFSKEIITHELEEFKKQKDPNLKPIIEYYERLKNSLNNLKENECILRLGQGSSALGLTLYLNFKDNPEIVKKYKKLEVVRFNQPDERSRGFAIAKQGRFTYFIDRNSSERPRINEKWLCVVTRTERNTKYVKLLEKETPSSSFKDLLFPLTRKFIKSNKGDLTYPYGWVKLKWE